MPARCSVQRQPSPGCTTSAVDTIGPISVSTTTRRPSQRSPKNDGYQQNKKPTYPTPAPPQQPSHTPPSPPPSPRAHTNPPTPRPYSSRAHSQKTPPKTSSASTSENPSPRHSQS